MAAEAQTNARTYQRVRVSFGVVYFAVAVSFFVLGFAYLFERSLIAEQSAERLIRTKIVTLSTMAQETMADCTQLCDALAEDELVLSFAGLTLAERQQAIRQVSSLQGRVQQMAEKSAGVVKEVNFYFPASRSVVTQNGYFSRDRLGWFFEEYGTLTEQTLTGLSAESVWHTLSGPQVGMRSVIVRTVWRQGRAVAYLMVTLDLQRMLNLFTEENECLMVGTEATCMLTNREPLRADYAALLAETRQKGRFTAAGEEYIAGYESFPLMELGVLVGVPAATRALGMGRSVLATAVAAFVVVIALLGYLYRQILRPLRAVFEATEVDAGEGTMGRALTRVAHRVKLLNETNRQTQQQLGSSLPLVIGKLIARLREENNATARQEIARSAAAIGLDVEGGTLVFSVCALNSAESFFLQEKNDIRSQRQVDLGCFVLNNLLQDLLFEQNPGIVVPVEGFYLVLAQRRDDDDLARTNKAIASLETLYRQGFGIRMGFSPVLAGENLIDFGANAVFAADTAAHLQFWGAAEQNARGESDFVSYFKRVRNIVGRLERGDYEGAAAMVGEIVDSLPTRVEDLHIAQYRVYGLISMLTAAVDEQLESDRGIPVDFDFEKRLYGTGSVAEFKRETEALLLEMVEYRRAHTVEEPSQRAVAFEKYIDEHYREYDLTVSAVAQHFGISESYLSRTFKQYKKCNVLEYIQELRVEAAKQLLKTETIKDTAAQVGFYDAQGLIRVFKRREGITPGEYKKLLEKEVP